MTTGINSLRIFSVIITDWETNFTDLETIFANLKLIEGALLSLSLSHHPSLSCFPSPLLSVFALCSSLLFALFCIWKRPFRSRCQISCIFLISGWNPYIFLGFRGGGFWIAQTQIFSIFLGFGGILGWNLWVWSQNGRILRDLGMESLVFMSLLHEARADESEATQTATWDSEKGFDWHSRDFRACVLHMCVCVSVNRSLNEHLPREQSNFSNFAGNFGNFGQNNSETI